MAGLPQKVIDRAANILEKLEEVDIQRDRKVVGVQENGLQLSFFQPKPSEIEEELRNIDILNITPIEAMNILNRLVEKSKEIEEQ